MDGPVRLRRPVRRAVRNALTAARRIGLTDELGWGGEGGRGRGIQKESELSRAPALYPSALVLTALEVSVSVCASSGNSRRLERSDGTEQR